MLSSDSDSGEEISLAIEPITQNKYYERFVKKLEEVEFNVESEINLAVLDE